MIDYEDWIFNELKIYQEKFKQKPIFISSWDCDQHLANFPLKVISESSKIHKNEFCYKFSEDLINTKESLKEKFNNTSSGWKLNNFSLGINATNSLYLVIVSLIKKNKKRFLVTTPIYYSIIDTINDYNCNIAFFHLMDNDDFNFNIDYLRQQIRRQYIEVLVISDPIYCAGIKIEPKLYSLICEMAIELDFSLVIDGTLSGLDWDTYEYELFPVKKLEYLRNCNDFYYVCSNPKVFFINDLKFSVCISTPNNTAIIEDLANQVTGGLNKTQIELFNAFLSKSSFDELSVCRLKNLETIKKNYNLLKSSLFNTRLKVYPTNSGYFTMLASNEILIKDIDPIKITKFMLYEYGILPILGNYFSFFKDNKLSLRINLMKEMNSWLPKIIEALSKNIKFVN